MVGQQMSLKKENSTDKEKPRKEIHDLVMEKYSGIARGDGDGSAPSCCGGPGSFVTISEIGEILDLTESRICQIHTAVLGKLQTRLKSYYDR